MTEGLSEAGLIAVVCEACGAPGTPIGPGDDAALVVAPPRGRQVVTTDALVEGVHFLRAHPPEALGWKALAVNLSDVAAMGARPSAFVLSAAVPEGLPAAWWAAFARGLGACAREAGAALVGGDTVRSPGPLVLSITAWGWTEGDGILRRDGGRAGDALMVRGNIGRSTQGLLNWSQLAGDDWGVDGAVRDDALAAHLRPAPPLDAGPWALANGATAGMDLSDGLATDLPRLAVACGLVLEVELAALPADPVCAAMTPDERAAGGEDYGLAVLVPAERVAAFVARGFASLGAARQPVGDERPGVLWRRHGARTELAASAFAHFSGG